MNPRFLFVGTLLAALCLSTPIADGILVSWSGHDLEGMTPQRWEVAKKQTVEEVLQANLRVRTWPDAYLCLLGANQHKDDKRLLSGLAEQLADPSERSLKDTGRLIVWERITTGEILFEGEGIQVEDDIFTVAGRANWLLRSITRKNFGYVKPKPSEETLRNLQATWNRWLAGDEVQEYSTPFASTDTGLQEIHSLAALEALIVSFKPSKEKDRKTRDCLRNIYHLDTLPTEPGSPGRLCSPDPWIHTYLGKLTDVADEHDAAWWSKWWNDNRTSLVWDPVPGRFVVRKESARPR